RVCPWSTGAGGRSLVAAPGGEPWRPALGSGKDQRMPLFVAQHRHPATACPAAPDSGALLLAHVSAATAARYGLAIQAEAVLDEAHELILIVEAAEQAQVERFMALFARFGSVQVWPASSSEEAVARGGCATDHGAAGRDGHAGMPSHYRPQEEQ